MKKIKLLLLFASLLLLLAGALAVQSNTEAAEPSKGVLADNDLSQRYVVFLGGINSCSPGMDDCAGVVIDFLEIWKQLVSLGVPEEHFVYFSYSAADYYQTKAKIYCPGWGPEACSDTFDLKLLYLEPVYTKAHTHISIKLQAEALRWLIEQIVKKAEEQGESAQIDLIGFSLGGIVTSYWASQIGCTSEVRDNVHSIVLINSPVGGIFPARAILDKTMYSELTRRILPWFEETVLTELQVPEPKVTGSLVASLEDSARFFKVTSIQSTMDFLVNGKLLNVQPFPPFGPVSIGRGSQAAQYWNVDHVRYHDDNLGGEETETVLFTGFEKLVLGNHNSALRHELTAKWVSEAIQSDPLTPNCQVGPLPTVGTTATLLVMDISGSMEWPDRDGGRKIDAARRAGQLIVNTLKAVGAHVGSSGQPETDTIGLVSFTDLANLESPLTTDLAAIESVLARLQPVQGTNVAHGLALANEQLAVTDPAAKRILILLSDGVPTVPLSGIAGPDREALKREILDGPVATASAQNYCIYAIGFGEPGVVDPGTGELSIDEDFLNVIAAASAPGCGGYFPATNFFELTNVYTQARCESVGKCLEIFGGQVAQGETTPTHPIQIPDGQGKLFASLNWPGSSLELILKDPAGTQVDDDYPGSSISVFDNLVYVIIDDPMPGEWQTEVFGQDVPEGVTPYNVTFSARAAPVVPTPVPEPTEEPVAVPAPPTPEPVEPEPVVEPSSGLTFVLFVVALLGVVGTAAFFAVRNRRAVVSNAGLRVIAGQASPPWASFRQGQLRLGRERGNELVLSDTDASRHHARIVQIPQGYLLEDMGSTNGTYVNGERVERQMLHNGDVIQIGHTQVRFEVGAQQ